VKKRIDVSVSNDIATDQRVRKQCDELRRSGYIVHLYGRLLKGSPELDRPYTVKRMRLPFNSGPLFYAGLNLALFFRLLFSSARIYWANDLDTLPANWLVSVLRGKPLIYDSHEYFTEVPELQRRPWVKGTWKFFERLCIGRARLVVTVNSSIAQLLKKTYGLKKVHVVRNVPDEAFEVGNNLTRSELGLGEDKFLLVLQGTGINVDRGGEELIQAMADLQGCQLAIIGNGDAIPHLKESVRRMNLGSKVIFFPRMPYDRMMAITSLADLGLSLDKDTNLNYRFSLPNKVFDYLRAGIPFLAGNLVEVAGLIRETQAGIIIDSITPPALVEAIERIKGDEGFLQKLKSGAKAASRNLSWQKEFEPILNELKRIHG
jgi:glycosyltransferase involved in cell wall biosynthesis